MANTAFDVVVIGGGIYGCSAAYHLVSHSARVLLLEADHCSRHAFGVNAGGAPLDAQSPKFFCR